MLIRFVFTFLVLASVVNSIVWQPLFTFNSNIDIIKAPLTFVAAGIVLFEILNRNVAGAKIVEADFLVLSSIVWFSITSFIFYITYTYLLANSERVKQLGVIHFISNLIYYFLFMVSLLIAKRRNAT